MSGRVIAASYLAVAFKTTSKSQCLIIIRIFLLICYVSIYSLVFLLKNARTTKLIIIVACSCRLAGFAITLQYYPVEGYYDFTTEVVILSVSCAESRSRMGRLSFVFGVTGLCIVFCPRYYIWWVLLR